MGIFQNYGSVPDAPAHSIHNGRCMRTRKTYGSTFIDARCKSNNLRTTVDQQLHPRYGVFSGTASATYKPHYFAHPVLREGLPSSCANCEACTAGTHLLRLSAPDYSYLFHPMSPHIVSHSTHGTCAHFPYRISSAILLRV